MLPQDPDQVPDLIIYLMVVSVCLAPTVDILSVTTLLSPPQKSPVDSFLSAVDLVRG